MITAIIREFQELIGTPRRDTHNPTGKFSEEMINKLRCDGEHDLASGKR